MGQGTALIELKLLLGLSPFHRGSLLVALGFFARNVTVFALQQFHQRFLIASLVGAACAGMAVALVYAMRRIDCRGCG